MMESKTALNMVVNTAKITVYFRCKFPRNVNQLKNFLYRFCTTCGLGCIVINLLQALK